VSDIIKSYDDSSQQNGLFAFFDLKHDFPNEWSAFVNATDNSPFSVVISKNYFPYFAQGKKITVNSIDLYGADITKYHAVGDTDHATNALKDNSAYTLSVPEDTAEPKVMLRSADAQVFLIICYLLS